MIETVDCPLCGGSRVDPGGLAVCRACAPDYDPSDNDDPDVSEAQEWHDFDPDC